MNMEMTCLLKGELERGIAHVVDSTSASTSTCSIFTWRLSSGDFPIRR